MFVINDHWYSSFVDIVVFDDGDAAAHKFLDVKALTQVLQSFVPSQRLLAL